MRYPNHKKNWCLYFHPKEMMSITLAQRVIKYLYWEYGYVLSHYNALLGTITHNDGDFLGQSINLYYIKFPLLFKDELTSLTNNLYYMMSIYRLEFESDHMSLNKSVHGIFDHIELYTPS